MTKYKNKHILTISKKCIYFLKVGDNMLYDYLVNNYEKGEPIFLMDIVIKGMTEENIRYHLKKMTDEGIIDRFDSGIYYIPRINIFGEKSTISAETVALHKYVYRRGKRVGFYSGYTLANRLGLSTQVPIKEEITRRPAVTITEENAYVLQLLDCLKDIDKSAEEDMKKCGKILTNYANEHRITREQVDKLLAYYPLKIYKAIYETGVKYVSA